VEPVGLSVASPIVQKAAELAKAKLDAADQLASSDAKRYVSYLEGALEAIRGLENEYVDILVEAMHCHVDQPEQSDHLAIRIKQYLYRETLRPHLVTRWSVWRGDGKLWGNMRIACFYGPASGKVGPML